MPTNGKQVYCVSNLVEGMHTSYWMAKTKPEFTQQKKRKIKHCLEVSGMTQAKRKTPNNPPDSFKPNWKPPIEVK
jgi:hypothetical protein